MIFNTNKDGLQTLFKPYQVLLLEWMWEQNKKRKVGTTSGRAHKFLQSSPERKSRAAVIFFLNDLVDERILAYEEKTGKGGYHRVYHPTMKREEFAAYVNEQINAKLDEVFPK